MTDYSERIPAAIARAEELLASDECGDVVYLADTSELTFTAGELALVKALWRVTMAEGWHIDPALREFVAKIERLGND